MRVLVTGTSRGVGRAIANAFARHHRGSLLVGLLDQRRHDDPTPCPSEGHARSEACLDVEREGGIAVDVLADDRRATTWTRCVRSFLDVAGGLDVLVHASSASSASARMHVLYEANTRNTMLCVNECRAALERSPVASIVTVSPPVRMGRLEWLTETGVPMTVSRYSMTLATLAEARSGGVRANCIWPRHVLSPPRTSNRTTRDFAEAVHRLAVVDTFRNAECVFDDDVLPDLPATDAPLNAYADERTGW